MKQFWFKTKDYGYGLTPITWQGWVALFFLIVLILLSGFLNGVFEGAPDPRSAVRFFLDILVLSVVFIQIFKDKTAGELRWNWGRREEPEAGGDSRLP